MTDFTPSAFWTKMYDDDGQWRYVRLAHATDLDINAEVAPDAGYGDRYPEVEVAEILFAPAQTSEWNDDRPYLAYQASIEVAQVSYENILKYVSCAGVSADRDLALTPNVYELPEKINAAPHLTDSDRAFFTERARWLAWGNGTDVTPDKYTLTTLLDTVRAVYAWRQMDAYWRAEAIFAYQGGDPTGYGDGSYKTFSDACISADIYRDDAEDDAEWDKESKDIEPYGPECRICGEPKFPRERHATEHANYLAEREREREAERAMDNVFDGD